MRPTFSWPRVKGKETNTDGAGLSFKKMVCISLPQIPP
jgi:hypothetical protein